MAASFQRNCCCLVFVGIVLFVVALVAVVVFVVVFVVVVFVVVVFVVVIFVVQQLVRTHAYCAPRILSTFRCNCFCSTSALQFYAHANFPHFQPVMEIHVFIFFFFSFAFIFWPRVWGSRFCLLPSRVAEWENNCWLNPLIETTGAAEKCALLCNWNSMILKLRSFCDECFLFHPFQFFRRWNITNMTSKRAWLVQDSLLIGKKTKQKTKKSDDNIFRWFITMVSRRKILSRSRDDLTLGEERTKHTQVELLYPCILYSI